MNIKQNKNKTVRLILPELYIAALNPKTKNYAITLEDIIELGRRLDREPKSVLIDFFVTLLILLWGAQVNTNTKFTWDKKQKDLSKEKIFQQTESHSLMAKFIANSDPSKVIISLITIQKAVNKDFYGITDYERENDENIIEAIKTDFENLILQKGSGSTKTIVTDAESRLNWEKAKNSSLRSTWIATPTYSPDKLTSAGLSIKSLKEENFWDFIELVIEKLTELNIIISDDKPSKSEINAKVQEVLDDLNIGGYVDDSLYGTSNNIPLESILNFKRNSKLSIEKRNAPIPAVVNALKSKSLRRENKT